MSVKTKNILRNIGFLFSIPVLIGAFVFAVAEDKGANVKAIEVEILNPEFGFVTTNDVQRSLMDENVILDYTAIENLNVAALEEKINSNPWVEHAEVFVTSAQSVKVKLNQVQPKLRVQRTDSTANGYYLDAEGFIIPLSRTYAADLPILTSERPITTIEQRKELVDFAQYIEQDTFWHATISQINLDKNNDIELISLIGDANIRFGSTENREDKFFRLFQFYKSGINRINWNNVKELDLRFDRQLVCRRYHKEKHIEESRVPKLYVKSKTKPAASAHVAVANPVATKAPKAKAVSKIEIPKRRKVASKKVWKEAKDENKIVNAKKVNKKAVKIVTKKKVVAKKKTALAKKSVGKKKKLVETKSKPTAKPRKKKREIIINTEPVTKK